MVWHFLTENLQKTEGEVTVILEKFIETAQNRGIGYQLCDASKSRTGRRSQLLR